MFRKDSPRKTAEQLLARLEKAARKAYPFHISSETDPVREQIAHAPPETKAAFVVEGIRRYAEIQRKADGMRHDSTLLYCIRCEICKTVGVLLHESLPFSDDDLGSVLEEITPDRRFHLHRAPLVRNIIQAVAKHVEHNGLTERLLSALEGLHQELHPRGRLEQLKLRTAIGSILDHPSPVPIEPGEPWSDAALDDMAALDDSHREAWIDLLGHCLSATASKPSAKWLKQASGLLDAVGNHDFIDAISRWFPLVDKPAEPVPYDSECPPWPGWVAECNCRILKGLAWCCMLTDDRRAMRALAALALAAYKKIPGAGAREASIGNACVYSLGQMPGIEPVGQLAQIKARVRSQTIQKQIGKALEAAAQRMQVPRDELDEMAVPSYGLTGVGCMERRLGDFTAGLSVTGTASTELTWLGPSGKRQQSIPAAVSKDFAEDLKEIKSAAKDIQKMLPAQRDRIDALYKQRRSWPFIAWRERYLDHPLMGVLARRLIWKFTTRGESRAGAFIDGRIVGPDDSPIAGLCEDTTVELWHPIGCPPDDVLAWRDWLERHEIRQPFKQAHREIYVLTDAERQTRTYSNRYAAHVVKQHQFNALCGARGWRNQLKLLVDATYPPPSINLPAWNLRAEFWTDGAGDETNEAGTFLYLSTDQVRFYPMDAPQAYGHALEHGGQPQTPAPPLPLDSIPPLVLSEVMRDIDLFVGVASVANDPTWSDGGPDGRYRQYWNDVAFGYLSATAQTRRDVLQRVIPRLKIAARCSFSDRFLVVRGDLRTYKIHLGSGNILMEPNDQYLCIVEDIGYRDDDRVFLPFEGDRTLAAIISKALLLADDAGINDPTITSQIRRK